MYTEADRRASKKYRETHKELLKQRKALYYQKYQKKIATKQKAYRLAHAEEYKIYLHEYHQQHREEQARKKRLYHQTNPQIKKNWNLKNAAKVKIQRRNSEARRRVRAHIGNFTHHEWVELCTIFQNRCVCCQAMPSKLTVDHILPISKGGDNYITNIQPLCQSCNSTKHAHYLDFRPDPTCT